RFESYIGEFCINNIAVEFSHNDVSSGPIEIGFDFPFYGEYYSQCIISPNGWIGFGEDNTEWQNGSIPSIDAPRPAIFPFWDDLNPINGGNSPDMEGMVYYQNSGDYFVIWFDHVAHWNGQIQGNYNFQAVLYPSGEIWYNYDALEGTINRATIGIQNGDGTDGIQVVMDDDYVQENLSTFFRQTPDWVELVSSSDMFEGSLYESESVSITVSVGSNELAMGEYSSVLKLTTNVEQPMVFPINLFVTESTSGDGDLNQDNDINVVDIVLLVNIIIGEISPDEYQLWAGDLNGDDVLDVLDIVDLVNIILEQ
ncbi:MAG: dockerin type I repeat-containing protein, partial [Fidelibacterota bacterium]